MCYPLDSIEFAAVPRVLRGRKRTDYRVAYAATQRSGSSPRLLKGGTVVSRDVATSERMDQSRLRSGPSEGALSSITGGGGGIGMYISGT